jgi:sugar phosphate isomerase/epimerase
MKKKQSRREFLKLSTAGTLGAIALSSYGFKSEEKADPVAPTSFAARIPGIGLQLYTLRSVIFKDVPGTLKKVSEIGYKYLELADYENGKFYGYEPVEFKKMVNDLDMKILSSHTSVNGRGISEGTAKKMAEDHAKLDVKYCVQPWVVEEDRTTVASWQRMVGEWNKAGKIMKETGIQFGYHNHNFEFANVEGKIPFYDIIMPELDKDLVTMEIDLFWTTKAGQDPVKIFNRYPGRFQLFHMKDMSTKGAPTYTTDGVTDFAPVGSGLINFKEILKSKGVAGMKYMIVEQDESKDDKPFDAIKTSITNLKTKILV